jgi:hypothetical protein
VKVDGEVGKKPVVVREPETGKKEYCFGLDVWRRSLKLSWKDYRESCQARVLLYPPEFD